MITITGLSYRHLNKDLLFENINLIVNSKDKIALIGNNGSGKSTLLKIMAGALQPSTGTVWADPQPWYVPQHFGQYNHLTVGQALGIDARLKALQAIIRGETTEANLTMVEDDWLLEERALAAFSRWEINGMDFDRTMDRLSGGEKTKILLAGIDIHSPRCVLLDEPTNHLDLSGRRLLYDYIDNTFDTLIIVSHDKAVLNLVSSVHELSARGITSYGGNFDFYIEQKQRIREAIAQEMKSKQQALRQAKETERIALERKQKLDARGKKKQEKAGLPTIVLNTLRNNAQKSTARLKNVHTQKIDTVTADLHELRKSLDDSEKMKLDLDHSKLHYGKTLIEATNITFTFHENNRMLWPTPLSLTIKSGERIALKGVNGSGKSTLAKIILGHLSPDAGSIYRADKQTVYIDQDYSVIDPTLTVYQQAQRFNSENFQEHEIKLRLNRFLFSKESWHKQCEVLSGGEKMRLILCCLMIANQAPDMIILDEPTNNLDIESTEILTNAIKSYKGTLIVISHDTFFLEQVSVERELYLSR